MFGAVFHTTSAEKEHPKLTLESVADSVREFHERFPETEVEKGYRALTEWPLPALPFSLGSGEVEPIRFELPWNLWPWLRRK